ncbi:MAG: hypothetical protein MZU95_10110 [Desulfomicrobium escambiense]|nr:hypothetical protein [Desulfomicrobium escambiense]
MEPYVLIPFLPLIAFLINILFGKKYIRDKAHWIAVPAVFASFVLAVLTFIDVAGGKAYNYNLYTWMVSGTFPGLRRVSHRSTDGHHAHRRDERQHPRPHLFGRLHAW